MYCCHCASLIGEDQAFCPSCGKATALGVPSISAKKISSRSLGLIVLISLLAFLWLVNTIYDRTDPPVKVATPASESSAKPTHSEPSPKQNASPQPAASIRLSDAEIKSRIAAGSQLFHRIKSRIPAWGSITNDNPSLWGGLTNNPSLALWVTNKIWHGLTKDEQVDLTWYVEDQIRIARTHPEKYVDIYPPIAPGNPLVEAARILCDDCWGIRLGDGRATVQGDSVWEKDDGSDRGSKASQFRGTASRPASANTPANTSTQQISLGAYFDRLEPICSAMEQLFLDRGYEVSVKPGAVGERVGIVVDCTKDPRPKVVCYSLYETFPDKADRRTLVKANVHVVAFRFESGWLANDEFVKSIQ